MTSSALPPAYRLSRRQKWRLALNLLVIYYPIMLYMLTPYWGGLRRELASFLVQFGTLLPFYFVWLSVAEWLQFRLFNWFGADFLLRLKLPAQLTLVAIAAVLALSFLVVWTSTLELVQRALPPSGASPAAHSPDYWELLKRANEGFFLMLMLSSFYLLATQQTQLRAQVMQQRAEQLENETLQAQLGALKNQVNPHFLFNSLSILSSLVHVDADLAEQFIEHLASTYRYSLEQRDHDLVALGTELEFIETYAFLLRLRFADKFVLQVDIPAAAHQHYRLAPLTLQLLVENAVKHNQMSAAQPLRVTIGLEGEELVVRNTLHRRPPAYAPVSTGVGLQNIRNRYHLLTPRPVTAGEAGALFIVHIPLLA